MTPSAARLAACTSYGCPRTTSDCRSQARGFAPRRRSSGHVGVLQQGLRGPGVLGRIELLAALRHPRHLIQQLEEAVGGSVGNFLTVPALAAAVRTVSSIRYTAPTDRLG